MDTLLHAYLLTLRVRATGTMHALSTYLTTSHSLPT